MLAENGDGTQEALEEIRKRRKEDRSLAAVLSELTDVKSEQIARSAATKINEALCALKSREPTSDNEFFRMNIIMYELGDLARAIVYAERFRNSNEVMFRNGFKDKNTILAEGKLAMADLLTQLHILCISMGWDIENLREIGVQHLAERQQDFKRDGWEKVK